MNFKSLEASKKLTKEKILTKFSVKAKQKPFGILVFDDFKDKEDFLEGISNLNCNFLILGKDVLNLRYENIFFAKDIESELLSGFDFFVCIGKCDRKIENFVQSGVVPILSKNNYLKSIIKEFDPLKGEGNGFLYENENKWSVSFAIHRFLENYKFPFDRKRVVENLVN